MSRSRRSIYARFVATVVVLGVLGVGASAYVLVQQRIVIPFADVYSVTAVFAEASGVNGGSGQPVNVVGVRVGQVTGVRLVDGRALVTLQIDRKKVARVYANATATLQPITPLKDMQIELDPGRPPSRPLPSGTPIGLRATSAPVPLEDLLSRLDLDTRAYLSSLIASLDQGTAGRATDIRRTLAALGPSAVQIRMLTDALASRRTELARLVHNLAKVSRAAAGDGRLQTVVTASNRTLDALTTQDAPLRRALKKLPGTLALTTQTLTRLGPFADNLGPTASALVPAVTRLPKTLHSLEQLSATGTPILARHIRPLVREAQPLARSLSPAVTDLDQATPRLTGVAKTLNYALNELAYNPAGDDEGFLFWGAWALHNLNSVLSTGDANGAVLRALTVITCQGAQTSKALQPLFKVIGTCPK